MLSSPTTTSQHIPTYLGNSQKYLIVLFSTKILKPTKIKFLHSHIFDYDWITLIVWVFDIFLYSVYGLDTEFEKYFQILQTFTEVRTF